MTDFILTNGYTLEDRIVDIEIVDGIIDRIVPAGEGDPSQFDSDCRYDADGQLVTPPIIETHTISTVR